MGSESLAKARLRPIEGQLAEDLKNPRATSRRGRLDDPARQLNEHRANSPGSSAPKIQPRNYRLDIHNNGPLEFKKG